MLSDHDAAWSPTLGHGACSGLNIKVIVSRPPDGCPVVDSVTLPPLKFKGITCSAFEACRGMTFVLENNGCAPILMEDLECEPDGACSAAHFDFDAGGGGAVDIQNCKCGPSCAEASGIDRCFDNLQILAGTEPPRLITTAEPVMIAMSAPQLR